jgi:hypothetical protein
MTGFVQQGNKEIGVESKVALLNVLPHFILCFTGNGALTMAMFS